MTVMPVCESEAVELARTPWPALPDRPLVVVPVGSTEQHGPHLPFTTDTDIAEAVARRIAAEADAVLAPALAYGSSGEHQDFAGTVSIGRTALAALITELARSLRSWAGRVVLVNGHGGNAPVLVEVVPELRAEGSDIGWVACSAPGWDAHAGRAETSLMLHLRPGTVRPGPVDPGDPRPLVELLPELERRGVRAVSENGVLGDPAGASAEEGAELLDGVVRGAIDRIASWSPDHRGFLRSSEGVSPDQRPSSTGSERIRLPGPEKRT